MTSMPASRSARAMIFAPRSCPSRPGFATTTRMFPAMSASLRPAHAGSRGTRRPFGTGSNGHVRNLVPTCPLATCQEHGFDRPPKLLATAGLADCRGRIDEREVLDQGESCPVAAPAPFLRQSAKTGLDRVEHDVGVGPDQIR